VRHLRSALVVAGWELRRYFKWRDQILGLAIFLLIGGLWYGASKLFSGDGRPVSLGLDGVELAVEESGRLRFARAPAGEAARREAIESGELDGILSRRPDGRFELLAAKEPRYLAELEATLGETVRRQRLAELGWSADDLRGLLAPPEIGLRFVDPARERRGPGEKIAAGVFAALMLMTVFTAFAYLLTGITGEKQLRVTESVVSAISPQAWIDGKLIGITAYSLVSIGNLVVGGLLVALGARLATGFTLPAAAVRPSTLLVLTLFTALGVLLWNSFFAAVAATIDDPNTSSRSSLMMVPALPVALSLAVIRDPDSVLARFLALFPATSAPAMPVRLVLAHPGWLEIVVSAALLAASIALLRRLAGRVFEVGILLYGKEPTWREISRWARERSGADGER
jgi:ABC-2 type transport system permease protein